MRKGDIQTLSVRRDARGFLEVVETRVWWEQPIKMYWYYDTDNWLRSICGREGAVPLLPMTGVEVKRVQKHYLHRLG